MVLPTTNGSLSSFVRRVSMSGAILASRCLRARASVVFPVPAGPITSTTNGTPGVVSRVGVSSFIALTISSAFAMAGSCSGFLAIR